MKHQLQEKLKQKKVQRQIRANLSVLQDVFAKIGEVRWRQVTLGSVRHPRKVLLVHCDGMVDGERLNRDILPIMYDFFLQMDGRHISAERLEETFPISLQATEQFFDPLTSLILRGHLIIFVDGIALAYVVDLANPPKRQPDEPSSEVSLIGPMDGFVEVLDTNVALIRKRLPTDTLCTESFTIGVRTQTKLCLLYIEDIIDSEILAQIRGQIQSIHIDAVYASAQLEQLLKGSKSIVPLFNYSGRPDFVVGSLVRGRFAIVLDGIPTVMMGPANLSFLFQSAEDEHMVPPFMMLQRGLRFAGLLITLLVPGFYIAIGTYHQDQIPLALLATIATSRRGSPFPTPLEAFGMLLMFELFREAGNRLPGKLGQTLAVVGGLVVGESAIDAGLTSPTLLVMVAVSSVASFTITNQSLAGVVTIFRFFILAASSFLGEFGFLVSTFAVLVYLSTIRSFGVPYLAPFSPFQTGDLFKIFKIRLGKPRKRPAILHTKDGTRE
ncbi:spore germination protein [Alicyclobacillus fodiniaquatilis]|uniref:Spore germination protein n=1 Tax=Alicyclobacillus fodiniaquatilis TaxID=1661150 RepID=A0ABW4JCX2_9BACL